MRNWYSVFLDSEFMFSFYATYEEMFDLTWPLHYQNPEATLEIRCGGI